MNTRNMKARRIMNYVLYCTLEAILLSNSSKTFR